MRVQVLYLILLICLPLAGRGQLQPDTMVWVTDTLPPREPLHLRMYSAGAAISAAQTQFFDGYNHTILMANAQAGIPLYSDWDNFSAQALRPHLQHYAAWITRADSARRIRLRLSARYLIRYDTLAYGSIFTQDDTVYGRHGGENTRFGSLSLGLQKSTRTFLGFLRLYGGGEFELGFSPYSRIRLLEFAYDIGDNRVVSEYTFTAQGKARLHGYLMACLGLETRFAQRFGFMAEVQSGLGMQVVGNSPAFGLSRNQASVGLQYYFFPGHW